MDNQPTIEQLTKEALDAETASLAAQKTHSDAQAKLFAARTATFNPVTVQKARDLGINPDNFDAEATLQMAVDKVQSEVDQAEPVLPVPPQTGGTPVEDQIV